MKIRIYDNGGKTADRYTVVLDKDVFMMSKEAHMSNGVNMYAGQIGVDFSPDWLSSISDKEIRLGDLPKGTLIGIINRLIYAIGVFEELEDMRRES